jgi:predicted enzyme related to lactoylglutathione lyase
LNCNPDLQPFVDRALEMGASLIVPKTMITPEVGFVAFVTDSEGNSLAFHSLQ